MQVALTAEKKCNRNSLGRRATVGRPEGWRWAEERRDSLCPRKITVHREDAEKALGERTAGCNGQDEVGGGGGALGQSGFSSGFSQPSK